MDMFSIFLISARSNDIKTFFVKDILVNDIIMSPDHFEMKNKGFVPYNG